MTTVFTLYHLDAVNPAYRTKNRKTKLLNVPVEEMTEHLLERVFPRFEEKTGIRPTHYWTDMPHHSEAIEELGLDFQAGQPLPCTSCAIVGIVRPLTGSERNGIYGSP